MSRNEGSPIPIHSQFFVPDRDLLKRGFGTSHTPCLSTSYFPACIHQVSILKIIVKPIHPITRHRCAVRPAGNDFIENWVLSSIFFQRFRRRVLEMNWLDNYLEDGDL